MHKSHATIEMECASIWTHSGPGVARVNLHHPEIRKILSYPADREYQEKSCLAGRYFMAWMANWFAPGSFFFSGLYLTENTFYHLARRAVPRGRYWHDQDVPHLVILDSETVRQTQAAALLVWARREQQLHYGVMPVSRRVALVFSRSVLYFPEDEISYLFHHTDQAGLPQQIIDEFDFAIHSTPPQSWGR
jgi:hypothetical protein